jgi:hypothetical protein
MMRLSVQSPAFLTISIRLQKKLLAIQVTALSYHAMSLPLPPHLFPPLVLMSMTFFNDPKSRGSFYKPLAMKMRMLHMTQAQLSLTKAGVQLKAAAA